MDESYHRFDYAELLAWHFPDIDFDDETGEPYGMPHYTLGTFSHFAEKRIEEMGISKETFYQQESIVQVLDAYSLDKEKFWYAVAYVRFLTDCWSHQKHISKQLPSVVEQLIKMRDEIKDCHEFKVVIDNELESHSFVMAGNYLIRNLVMSLDDLIVKVQNSNMVTAHEVPIWRKKEQHKMTERTWYVASLFSILLKELKLPTLRSRSIKSEFREQAGEIVKVKGRDAVISYDKNQLIAELIHFLGLTDNENLDGNSIKGILKKPLKGIGFM